MAKKKTKKQKQQDPDFEAMRKRALQPFKPSLTDEDITQFENEVRKKSLENMKELKNQVKQSDKERIMEQSVFEHHL